MPHHHSPRSVWIVAGFIVILAIGIFLGVQLAHGNSDYVCSSAVNDTQQGACTGGSWSAWTTAADGTLQRTYTGTQASLSFAGSTVVSCSHPAPNVAAATGNITTAYSACQIVETGTSSSPSGGSTGGPPGSTGTITSTGQTVTTGAVSTSTQVSGSYTDYQNAVDDALATISINAAPSIVRPGDVSTITWTSSHVKSCTVTGTNGDAWPKSTGQTDANGNPVTDTGVTGSEPSTPITQQTIYTLSCLTNLGRALTQQVTVTILPTYQEL
jgi:hypothetical protein